MLYYYLTDALEEQQKNGGTIWYNTYLRMFYVLPPKKD